MNFHKKLWNWCRRPVKPASTNFTKFATPLYVSILIGGLLLTVLVSMVLLPQIAFPSGFRLFSDIDESGRVTEVVERVLFPGGAIVVYKHPIDIPQPTWYISIGAHNYITCEEDLLAYVDSRTNALNQLLNSLSADRKVQVTVTFKEPLDPTDFKNLYGNYHFAENDGNGPNRCAIIVENETSGGYETFILYGCSSDFFEEIITQPIKGSLKMISIISFDAFVKVNVARTLTQDSRILLVDPQECLTVSGLVTKYSLMGFNVTVDRPPILIRVFEPYGAWGATTIHELLTNPSKYNRWRLYFNGKVSDFIENTFQLDEKLLVCYKYYGNDLSEQIDAQNITNGDYVTVIGTFFQEHSTLYADKIEKKKQEQPSTLTVDKLLTNTTKYDGQVVQVFGRVSELGSLDGPFFKLDGKILVCYSYDDVNLYSQINGVENEDPMIVTGVFHQDGMVLYARNLRPSK